MAQNCTQRIASATKRQKLNNAFTELHDGAFVHIHQAAQAIRTTRSTNFRHLNRGLSKHNAQCNRQQLSPEEESALAKWVWCLSSTGYPVHHSFLRELVEEIQKLCVADSTDLSPLRFGKHWVPCFLSPNPIFQSKIAKNIKAAHKKVTETQLENWFKEFKQIVEEYGILLENIYNIDETGSDF